MAYYIHYQIPFKTLRSGTSLMVNIYKEASSQPTIVTLRGGAQPFTTDEDDDEDMFTPIRTQSGYLRIVDNGQDANGNSFNWTNLIPATDVSNPVTLTSGGTILWQGFMQAQDFGSTIYGNPQEREFPVQCTISVMQGLNPTLSIQTKNFAYLLKTAIDAVPQIGSSANITTIYIQGGTLARQLLLKKVDWQNFMSTGSDVEDDDVTASYSLYQMLEDMCGYWGWTLRTSGKNIYLTCMDDAANGGTVLVLNQTTLATMAGGTAAGSTSTCTSYSLPETYASDDNEVSLMRGYSNATVKADVGDDSELMTFAPPSVEKWMENMGYTWVGKDGSYTVGLFTTPIYPGQLTANRLIYGYGVSGYSGFCRRQIFSSEDTEQAEELDMLAIYNGTISAVRNGATRITLQSKKWRSFGEGSLKITGDVYCGPEKIASSGRYLLWLRIGIGATRATAKWWYCETGTTAFTTQRGWSSSEHICQAEVYGSKISNSTGAKPNTPIIQIWKGYEYIPLNPDSDASGLEGYLFVEVIGLTDTEEDSAVESFEIGNFAVEYSRKQYTIPASVTDSVRGRTLAERRTSTREYSGTSGVNARGDWNRDMIFASDNNMEYGFGLLMNTDGTFMGTVTYSGGEAYPEQHLVDRVTAYWATSKRKVYAELQSQAVDSVMSPIVSLTMGGASYCPISVSHDWRDDVTRLTMLEL